MELDKEINNKRTIKGFENFKKFSNTTNYIYDKVIYVNSNEKVIITCSEHGDFEQTPSNHKQGQGCPKCKFKMLINLHSLTTEEFVKKANKVHQNFYGYSKTDYTDYKTKISISCPIHGVFKQKPSEHLAGKGCQKCGINKNPANNPFTKDKFVERANIVHDNKYDYTNSQYIKMQVKLTIVCPIHGTFEQKAANHIQGQGCPSCGNTAKLKRFHEHPTILYMLFFPKLNLYKLGITMEKRGIKTRYSDEKEPYEIHQQILFNSGEEAYTLEQNLLLKYKDFSYSGPNVLKAGNTELFVENILLKHFIS